MKHWDYCVRSLCIALTSALSVCVVAAPASADTMVLSWDPNPEPEVVGYILHVGTQSGWYTQRLDAGMATSFAWSEATAGQQYCFALSAYFAGYLEGPLSSEVCGYSNEYPFLTNPGSLSSTRGEPTEMQLQGGDPKGEPVSYTATGLPEGMSVMWSTGYIFGTAMNSGAYFVTATVSDGVLTSSQTFTWTIMESNTNSGWDPGGSDTAASDPAPSDIAPPDIAPSDIAPPDIAPWTPSGTGLSGNYFSGLFETFLATRVEAVDFTWGYEAPSREVPADYFSVQWTGQLVAPVTGTYTFSTVSDDGVRLWVANQWLIDNWAEHGTTTDTSGGVFLEAGQTYPVRLDYYDSGGGAIIQLLWAVPGQGSEVIPQSALIP
jgi:hypothetical protein